MDLSMLPDFIVEAVEHLEDMEDSLLQLEQDQDQGIATLLDEIFRAIHSIKGAAQYIGLERVSKLSHKLESLMDLVRQGKKELNQNIIDLFIAARDRIALLVDELDRNQIEEAEVDDLLQRISDISDESQQSEQLDVTTEENKDYEVNEPDKANELDELNEVDEVGKVDVVDVENDLNALTTVPEPARLENETLEDEFDEELLDIFLQQFKENIVFLQTQITELATSSDKELAMNGCRDTIKSLLSSANYMGYTLLCAHYEAWQVEIEKSEGGGDFMQSYLDEIIRAYPEFVEDTSQEEEETPLLEQNDEQSTDSFQGDNLAESVDAIFDDMLDELPASDEEDVLHEDESDNDVDEFVAALSDAFDEISPDDTSDTSSLAKDQPVKLKNESLDEGYDVELVNIFSKQLQENIGFLETQIAEIDTSVDIVAVLQRCSDTIKSLLSSANYMGYEMLSDLYTTWQTEIDDAEQEIASGKESQLDFMQSHLDEIVSVYPQAIEAVDQLPNEDSLKDGEDALAENLYDIFGNSSDESPAGLQDTASPTSEEPEDDLSAALDNVFDEDIFDEATIDEASIDEITVTEASGKTQKQLDNETLQETHDEELLNIFMEQLKENIAFLQRQIEELASSVDKVAVLDRCKDTLKGLHSSASYMGYDILCDFYKSWQEELDTAQQKIADDDKTAVDFMQDHLDEIVRVYFDNATDKEIEQLETSLLEQTEDGVASSASSDSSDYENVGEALDTLFSDPSAEDAPDNEISDEEETLFGESSDEDSIDEEITHAEKSALENTNPDGDAIVSLPDKSSNVQDDPELYGKLQDALECSLDEKQNVPEKLIHGVIEEMISSSDEDSPYPVSSTEVESTTEEDISEDQSLLNFLPSADKKEKSTAAPKQVLIETEQRPIKSKPTPPRKKKNAGTSSAKQTMRVDVLKIDYLMNQVGELVVSRSYFSQLFNEIKALQQGVLETAGLSKKVLKPLNEFSFRLGEAGVALGRVSNELQEAVMKVRMLPVSQLFKRYPRLVRDLANSTGKQVQLELRGETTELDKMVIEAISDPLIHIIRNAIDHGIESASVRKQLGKPESGTLVLEAYHESNHIVIEITDDGKGIDPERIRTQALAKGLFSDEELERMSSFELIRLVMVPGFSTTKKATTTSGRGVGMDVVQRNIERLNGTIDIESIVGQQTQMRIKIPLTLAIIQALLVRVGLDTFTIPLTAVEETLRVYQHDISKIEGVEVIHIRNTTMPIFRLSSLFNIRKSSGNAKDSKFFVVVVSTGMQEVGLVVDELLGQEEVVIKPLAEYLQVDSGFSGATIIGGGAISLILDIPELIKMTLEQQVSKQRNLASDRKTSGSGIAGRETSPTIH